jgi:probable HAF family extracellular repeat protein
LRITINWPAASRLIPEAATLIAVSLTRQGQVITSKSAARPANAGTTQLIFESLPSGDITVSARAKRSSDPGEAPLATGTASIFLPPNGAETASVTMSSTIEAVTFTPATPRAAVGQQAALVATAKDVSGAMVLTTPSKWTWASSDTSVATVTASTDPQSPPTATVHGHKAGTVNITATETESGKSGQVTVVVGTGGGTWGTFDIVEVGAQLDGTVTATDINDSGQVVGYSTQGGDHPFIYDAGQVSLLGSLAGTSMNATSVNNSGTIAGNSGTHGGSLVAALRAGPGWTALSASRSYVHAINSSGVAVGWEYAPGDNGARPAVFRQGAVTYLAESGVAFAINDAGTVAGYRYVPDPVSGATRSKGFVWEGGTARALEPLPGHQESAATGLNADGDVVGWSRTATGDSGPPQAVLWSAGEAKDISPPGSSGSAATDINRSRQIVGSYIAGGTWRAFLYRNDKPHDLNDLLPPGSGWVLTWAQAINDSGQITGIGTYNGFTRAFLLTPK